MTRKQKQQRQKPATQADGTAALDEEIYDSQEKLAYLRGARGEKDRRTIWAGGRGLLPGTGEGGLVEGWLDRD